MKSVTLNGKSPSEILNIVSELKAMGLVQGKDFDFAYTPPNSDYKLVMSRYTVFTFYEEKYSTYFELKWG